MPLLGFQGPKPRKRTAGRGDAQTDLLLGFDTSTTIIDYSPNAILTGWSIAGVGTVNAVQAKFGAGAWNAGEVSTSGNTYINRANHAAFRLGAGNFTIDYWIYSGGYDGVDHCSLSNGGAGDWAIASYTGLVRFNNVGGAGELVSAAIPATGQWNHIAVVRNSGSLRMYINGVGGTAAANSTDFNNTTAAFRVGAVANFMASTNAFIDELRISSVARWTDNFTPPTSMH